MALDNFTATDPALPSEVYQEIEQLKKDVRNLARALDSALTILANGSATFSKSLTAPSFRAVSGAQTGVLGHDASGMYIESQGANSLRALAGGYLGWRISHLTGHVGINSVSEPSYPLTVNRAGFGPGIEFGPAYNGTDSIILSYDRNTSTYCNLAFSGGSQTFTCFGITTLTLTQHVVYIIRYLAVNVTTGLMAQFSSTAANGGYITFAASGISFGDIGTAAQTMGGSVTDFSVNSRPGSYLILGAGNVPRLYINPTDGTICLRVAAATPTVENNCVAFSAISNTQLRVSYRGTDGVVRTGTIAVS